MAIDATMFGDDLRGSPVILVYWGQGDSPMRLRWRTGRLVCAILAVAAGPVRGENADEPSQFARSDSLHENTSNLVDALGRCVKARTALAAEIGSQWESFLNSLAQATTTAIAAEPEMPSPEMVRSRCRASFSAEEQFRSPQFLSSLELASSTGQPRPAGPLATVLGISHFICKGVAARDHRSCQPLGKQKGSYADSRFSFDGVCAQAVHLSLIAQASRRRDPEGLGLCRNLLINHTGYKPSPALDRACEAVIGPGAEDEACAQVEALGLPGSDGGRSKCRWMVALMRGQEADCSQAGAADDISAAVEGELCRQLQAARKAVPAKSPAACGKAPLCRVLAGDGPSACDAYLEPLRDRHCEKAFAAAKAHYNPKTAEERRRRVAEAAADVKTKTARDREVRVARFWEVQRGKTAKLEISCWNIIAGVQKALEDLNLSLMSIEPRSLPGITPRTKKAEALQGRFRKLMKSYAATKMPGS